MIPGFFKKDKKAAKDQGAQEAAGSFEAEILEAPGRDALLALRREVLGEQAGNWKADDPYSPFYIDDFEEDSVHIVCKETAAGKAIGYARLTPANKMAGAPVWNDELNLKVFAAAELEETAVFSKVIVTEAFRKGSAAMELASKCYEVALGEWKAWICLQLSELTEFNFNRFLGFRPLAKIHHSRFGGYRIPLFLIVHDYERLKASDSPLYEVSKRKGQPKVSKGKDWMKHYHAGGGRIDTGFFTFDTRLTKNYESTVTAGMSEKGREQFMAKSFHLKCGQGEIVLRQGEGGAQMGFVMKGALEVRNGEQVLAVLAEGDVFGEIAAVLGTPRSADVVAAVPNSEIMLLRMSVTDSLSDSQDTALFWKNLCVILGSRLAATGRLIEGAGEGAVFAEIAKELGRGNPQKSAALASDTAALLTQLAEGENLSDGRQAASFWKKLAGLFAGRLVAVNRLAAG